MIMFVKKMFMMFGNFAVVRKILLHFLQRIDRFVLMHLEKGFLDEIGWTASFKKDVPVDKNGNPIPKLCYSMIFFLKERITINMMIFEFGSGQSTLFFSKLAKKVVTVEHDKNWFERINSQVPDNVDLKFCELKGNPPYFRAASDYGENFDVIIIDGRDRVNCVFDSYKALKDEGVVIFDDSYREEKYDKAFSFLKEKGFKTLSFHGISPGCLLDHKSTIFYRDKNVFNI